MKKRKKKNKPKRKLNKYEKQFIKDYGIEIYKKMLWAFPHLKDTPMTWRFIEGMAKCWIRNAPPGVNFTLKDMYEAWTEDFEEDEVDE